MANEKYMEPVIPVEFRLKNSMKTGSDKIKQVYETWRVIEVNTKTCEIRFISSNTSVDWKTAGNAKSKAEWMNRVMRSEDLVYVAKRCRVTVEEI